MGILQFGFKNVYQGNEIAGFQVKVVNSYYRGTYVSLTEGFDVTVDGETFSKDKVTCTFGTATLPQDELDGSMVRWQYTKPVTLTVNKPGGLKRGLHDVAVNCVQRISYMPEPLTTRSFTARIMLVI